LHGQKNQRTHNAEKEEQQVKLCTNSTKAIVVASHVANKKNVARHHVVFTLKPYSKITSMQNHR
jgi:hypothetical protein